MVLGLIHAKILLGWTEGVWRCFPQWDVGQTLLVGFPDQNRIFGPKTSWFLKGFEAKELKKQQGLSSRAEQLLGVTGWVTMTGVTATVVTFSCSLNLSF